MEQPWHGKAKMPYRVLLGRINKELHSPLTRCPDCEEPYIPTITGWPKHTGLNGSEHVSRRYLLCPYCGHRSVFFDKHWKRLPIFTPKQVEQILDLYAVGMNPNVIAKHMGCHPNTVRNYVRAGGLKMRPRGGAEPLRGISHTELEQIRVLYEIEGLTQREIARRLNKPKWTVQKRVHQGGMIRKGSKGKAYRNPPEQKVRA